MKSLRILFFLFLLFSCEVFAQRSRQGEKPLMLPMGDSLGTSLSLSADTTKPQLTSIASDTGELSVGIIYVRKPHIIPYVKVDYKLYLAHVKMVKVEVPVDNGLQGNVEIDNQPVFDSNAYSKKLKRDYPVASDPLSKYFVSNMQYQYQSNDTPRVDTMVIGFWIDTRGRIKRALPDTEYVGNMPSALVTELAKTSWTISNYGAAGGYYTPKKFLRPSKLTYESYYCEAYVIVSSYPLTVEQHENGTAYAPFDFPLNCPAIDPEQKKSLEKNGYVVH